MKIFKLTYGNKLPIAIGGFEQDYSLQAIDMMEAHVTGSQILDTVKQSLAKRSLTRKRIDLLRLIGIEELDLLLNPSGDVDEEVVSTLIDEVLDVSD